MKLLLIGSESVHLPNYLELVRPALTDYKIVSNRPVKGEEDVTVVAPFTYRSIRSIIRTIRILRKTIHSFNPDIIHVHQANVYALLTVIANKKTLKPLVVTGWGSDILVTPSKHFFHRWVLAFVLKHANAFTCGSLYMKKKLMSYGFSADLPVLVANFGIRVDPNQCEKENIIYSNRLHEPIYRIDRIIREFETFYKSEVGKSWRLVIAGSGSQTAALKVLTDSLGLSGVVDFVGWLSFQQNSAYYNRSSIYCSLPVSDSAAISVVESMACGCVPVVTDLPAMRELVTDQQNGLLVGENETGIFERVLDVSWKSARKFNMDVGAQFGSRTINSAAFIGLYHKLLNV